MKAGTEIVPDFEFLPNPRVAPKWYRDAEQAFRKNGSKDWHPMRVYRSCLKTNQFFGERPEKVFIYYLATLIPALEMDPWSQVKVWTFYDTRNQGRRGTNWFGCQSASKSGMSAAMSVAFGVLNPEATNQKVAEPFKASGEKKVWRMVQRWCESVKKEHRASLALMKCAISNSTTSDKVRFGMFPDAGFLDLIAADEPGKLQGDKAVDVEQTKGYLIAWLGEIALHPTQAFLEVLPNLTSNQNFHFVTDCNPELVPGNLDTELGKPRGGFKSLDLDRDYRWESAYGTITYRFDGLKSPNMEFTGKAPYPYLFSRDNLRYFEDHYGKGNPKYDAQVRGLSKAGIEGFFITNLEKLTAGKVFKSFEWLDRHRTEVGYCDLGFGGDPAVFTHLTVGTIRDLAFPEGFESIVCREQFTIPIRPSAVVDEEWTRKILQIRGSLGDLKVGDDLDAGKQLAIECALACRERGIDYHYFGFDDSMRGWAVADMIWSMGQRLLVVSYEGGPQKNKKMWPPKHVDEKDPKGKIKKRAKMWHEEVGKFVSQVWFMGAEILHHGLLFRGGDQCTEALDQMENRRWLQRGTKKDVEPKDDYKVKFKRSPDNADSLLGGLHVCVERNLVRLSIDKSSLPEPSSHKSGGSGSKTWDKKRRKAQQRGLHRTGTLS